MKCECGLYDGDPHHKAWHRIVSHNDEVFAHHRRKQQEKFDASLREREKLSKKVEARRMRMVQATQSDNT